MLFEILVTLYQSWLSVYWYQDRVCQSVINIIPFGIWFESDWKGIEFILIIPKCCNKLKWKTLSVKLK